MKKTIIRMLEVLLVLGTGYLSLIVMLIGGISQIVHAINPFVASDIVIGIVKIIFSELPIAIGLCIAYYSEIKLDD